MNSLSPLAKLVIMLLIAALLLSLGEFVARRASSTMRSICRVRDEVPSFIED